MCMVRPAEWVDEQFFDNADGYYKSIFEFFEKARSTIDFEVYIFEKSNIGDQIIDALKAAAQRGVRVRLLVDGFGSSTFSSAYSDKIAGLGVRIYHPVPWAKSTSAHKQIETGWGPGTYFQLIASLNSRDHRKVCIIDSKHAFLGSYNVTDVHLASVSHEKAWRDYGVRVSGQCVELLEFGFKKAWDNSVTEDMKIANLRTSQQLKKYYRYFILNHSLRSRLAGRHRILSKIRGATQRIWLVTPYFVPALRVIRMLKSAAERGVDVRLMLPLHNDVIFMHSIMKTYYGVLLKSGVKIFEYKPSMLHAKAAIIDDWCALGSMNLNSRSIIHDLEANYVLQTPQEKAKLFKAVEEDFGKSILISDTASGPWYERYFGQMLLVFKYWI